MSSLMDKKVIKDDRRFVVIIAASIMFIIWLVWPQGNNTVKITFWANNLIYNISNTFNIGKTAEYKHYQSNAKDMVRIYPKKSYRAIKAMDKAIEKAPNYISESELSRLYVNRALIKLYYGDKKGAIGDYMLAKRLGINDDFRLAVLLTENHQYRLASEYCKDILEQNSYAFYGYACLANVYEAANRKEAAVKVYDIAIEKKPNNAVAYVERANLKKRLKDMKGYQEDMAKAKSILPNVDINKSVINESVNSKKEILASM